MSRYIVTCWPRFVAGHKTFISCVSQKHFIKYHRPSYCDIQTDVCEPALTMDNIFLLGGHKRRRIAENNVNPLDVAQIEDNGVNGAAGGASQMLGVNTNSL